MKKVFRFSLVSVFLLALTLVAFTYGSDGLFYSVKGSSGALPGYSGDPANGDKNCTHCHSGPDETIMEGWITSNIPEDGYIEGTTYTVTATAKRDGHVKFGFQVSPQNESGVVLGTLVNTGASTKLVSGSDYITHTYPGTAGTDSNSWSFDWIAPESGSGDLVFYGAFNITNNNGNTSGDTVILSTLAIDEAVSINIFSEQGESQFNIYPNPASEYIILESHKDFAISRYTIFDLSGKQVLKGQILENTSHIPISPLKSGSYFLQIEGAEGQAVKFLKE